jgi:hypothetical protein
MNNPVCVLWLEGINPENLTAVPSLAKLVAHGVDLRLAPLPLIEKGQCYYQTLCGMGSGKFGRFDSVQPEGYRARNTTGIPDGALGRLLPDVLRARKLAVTFLEVKSQDALDTLAGQALDLALIRLCNADTLAPSALEAVVKRCLDLATPAGHMLVLTDVWRPAPQACVNVNDFLAAIGLLEVKEPRRWQNIVWFETLAYGLGSGQIWINLRGREPQGIVDSGHEYQQVCDALMRELCTNWLAPQTNEPVVEQVFKKDEIYSGEYLFKAPDLITVYRPGYVASAKATALNLDGASVRRTEAPTQVRQQAPYARLIASGPLLESGLTEQARLIDVAPSLLYLLGQPVPVHMDGEVVLPMFTQDYRRQVSVERVDDEQGALSDEEEGLVVDRLRDLGYLG